MSNDISQKDKKDWEKFIKSKEKVTNKDTGDLRVRATKTKTIDLHGYTLEGANKVINQFITKAYEDGISKLIVVTGKGIHSHNEKDPYVSKDLSILKYSVPEFIENNDYLMKMIREITDAKIEDGGSGAFYIFLKRKKS